MATNDAEFRMSRRVHILVMLCQTIGTACTISIPTGALASGTTGNILCAVILFIVIGIPLLYMESIVSQFTARDCISVWTIRKCLSHIGYVQVIWQILFIIYNHNAVSFLLHYFLISFEKPIPYFLCGSWSDQDCDILLTNYTVNEDCIKRKFSSSYCDQLHTTYPEYQYWRFYILEVDNTRNFFIVWRVCLASGFVCAMTFLSCFKRMESIKCFVHFFVIYPIFAYILLLTGSMLQKGIVVEYEDVLDLDFNNFSKKFRLSNMIQQVIFTLTIGSGITFNFASGVSFRSPCYSNVVICVAITIGFIVLTVCTTAMMYCPYAYHYRMKPEFLIRAPMTLLFEKIPRLIRYYRNSSLWLPLIYSANAIIGLNTNVIAFFNLLEMVRRRNSKVAKYPGLICLTCIVILFLITIPLQSKYGINLFLSLCRTYLNLLSTFIAAIECFVFVLMYGMHRFGEDVHFMLGVQPSIFMKIGWVATSIILLYAFCNEIHYRWDSNNIVDVTGRYLLLVAIGYILFGILLKLLIAVLRKDIWSVIRIDPSWGPASEILQRSRGMFTAQAMTKEYMYRQYHLQAGIIARQRKANVRDTSIYDNNFIFD
ncbi:PREDICTED: sodium- and chloride-dependent glycine transporter 1-like [Papilio xuthus]|uniref:Sodium- and chloride-dependent glycine transporter 1-like n=1 Tax=Papilio xuthus TaxID=66420 RepID=A0AAJ6YZE0_PAPXU|nr:PREDICTED: sodium- and chloride-dependent glycine transporter 1-like [Papilio xuthus]